MFVKNLSQNLNFPKFDKPNFNTGFIYNFRQNLYSYLGQTKDILVQNNVKWRKIQINTNFMSE